MADSADHGIASGTRVLDVRGFALGGIVEVGEDRFATRLDGGERLAWFPLDLIYTSDANSITMMFAADACDRYEVPPPERRQVG